VGPEDDFERLRDAYAEAWQAREAGHPAAADVLVSTLDSLEDDVFSGPGPGRDLMLRLWERGVPPDALRHELIRAMPRLAVSAAAAWGRTIVKIAGHFRGGAQPEP
jgi:hypothetical protein